MDPITWLVPVTQGILPVMQAAWLLSIVLCGSAVGADPDLSPNPRGEFPSESRKQRLKEEISDAWPGHPWAGSYYAGDGLGMNNSLLLSPSGEYSFQDSNCFGPSDWGEGVARYQDGILTFEGTKSSVLTDTRLLVVPWGKRVYLIDEDRLVSFGNAVNLGSEPRYRSHGFYLMRAGGETELAIGKPRVPKAIEAFLLDRPIDATITSVGASTKSTEPYSSSDFETEVILDIGRRKGVLPGMKMGLTGKSMGDAEITLVQEKTSLAILRSHEVPTIGSKLSTRWDFMKELSPKSLPYRTTLTTSTVKIYPRYQEAPKELSDDDTFKEARENGFTVTELARIEFLTVDRSLLRGKIFSDAIAGLSMRMGSNAYVAPFRYFRDSDLPGSWLHSQGVVAYRIEFDGRLVDADDFDESFDPNDKYRPDWPRTRANILLRANSYHKRILQTRKEVACGFLLLAKKLCDGWDKLKVGDLSPEQLQAFKTRRGLMATRGRVADALPTPDEKWWADHTEEVEKRMMSAREADPAAYAEYTTLNTILYSTP